MPVEPSEVVAMLKRIHLFRGIDEMMLDAAVPLLEVVEFKAGDTVYQQGDVSEYFYFLYSGRVRGTRYEDSIKQIRSLGYLEEDDYFGHEVLESKWPRQTSIVAETDLVLLALSIPRFITLLEMMPVLGRRLQLILDSFRLMLSRRFSWMDQDETIYFVARKHVLFLWGRILPPTLIGIFVVPIFLYFYLDHITSIPLLALVLLAVLGILGWWLWGYVDWTNDYYIVTNRRVVYKERVIILYESRQESPIEAVQSTSTNTSQLGRWLGYGNVAIRTYIGTILFRSVSMPEQVMALIQEQQVRAQTGQRRAELRAMETLLERKIGLVPVPPAAPKPAPSKEKISPFQRFLADVMHMRYETGGTILYRTHWFQLMKKVLLPGLLLIFTIGLTLFSVANLLTVLPVGIAWWVFILLLLISGGWFLYQFMDWHNDVYLITPDQIVDVNKKPLGREFRQAAPIKNILSIEYQRLGIIGRIFNFGTVYIRVGDQQLTFDNVFNPGEVQRELFHRLAAKNYAEKQAQAENERQRMADWIATYHRVAQRSQPPRTPPAKTGF